MKPERLYRPPKREGKVLGGLRRPDQILENLNLNTYLRMPMSTHCLECEKPMTKAEKLGLHLCDDCIRDKQRQFSKHRGTGEDPKRPRSRKGKRKSGQNPRDAFTQRWEES